MERLHINHIRIILTDPKTKYQSGDHITGKVVISTIEQLLVSLIKINLSCIVEVKWVELPGLKSSVTNVQVLGWIVPVSMGLSRVKLTKIAKNTLVSRAKMRKYPGIQGFHENLSKISRFFQVSGNVRWSHYSSE